MLALFSLVLLKAPPGWAGPGTSRENLSSPANLLYQEARFLLLDGYKPAALAKLEQARALAPRDVRVAALKARVLAAMGQGDKALDFCQELLGKDTRHFFELYFEIAYIHVARQEYPRALAALAKARAKNPGRALREKGQLLYQLKRYRDAARAYRRAIVIDPDNRAELKLLLARAIYKDRDYQTARNVLAQVAGHHPSSFVGKGAEALAKEVDLADRPWWLGVSLGGLWDSNVYQDPLVADPARAVVTGESDFAWQTGAWGGLRLYRRGRFSAGLTAYLNRTDYLERTSGSYAYLAPGLYAAWGRADWGWRVSYVYYHYYNSGDQDEYAQMHYLAPTLYWWATPRLVSYFTLALAERDYFNPGFSGALYGSASGDHRWYLSHARKTYFKLIWQVEREDAYDSLSGYSGYSAGLGLGSRLGRLNFSLTASYLCYEYDRRQEFTLDYAWFQRNDQQIKLSLSAWFTFGRWWTVALSAYHLSNDSNVATGGFNPYDYEKAVVSLLVSKSF